jgi:hypothetical protein
MDKHGKRKIEKRHEIEDDTRDDVSTGSSSSSSSVSSTADGILDVETFSERITPPFSMAMASARNTGKTLLVSVLINELVVSKKIDLVLVMSQTAHVNDDYWFISSRLRQPFSETVIEKLMVKQSLVKKGKREQVLLVLDDVLSSKEAENSRFIKKLYTLGRHYDISIILISQTSNVALTPAIKQNSDYLGYSRLNKYQLLSLYESITNMGRKEFVQYSETNNKNFVFIFVDNTTQSNSPDDFLVKVRVSEEEASSVAKNSNEEVSDASSEEDE